MIFDKKKFQIQSQFPVQDQDALLRKVYDYMGELSEKAPEQLEELYQQERKKELEEQQENIRQQRCRQEERYIYNNSSAKVDYDYWSKMSYWTIEEACALLMDKNPHVVTWGKIRNYKNSDFVRKYKDVRSFLERAIDSGELPSSAGPYHNPARQIQPNNVIFWAKRIELSYPKELGEKVARYHNAPNYQVLYNEKSREYEQLNTQLEETRALIQKLQKEKSGLQQKLNTAQLLFSGVVDEKFPKNKSLITNVMSALQRQGISISKTTVAKHYNKGVSIRSNKESEIDGEYDS